jgi:hypothetical protein
MKFVGDVAAPFLLGALLIGAPACSPVPANPVSSPSPFAQRRIPSTRAKG